MNKNSKSRFMQMLARSKGKNTKTSIGPSDETADKMKDDNSKKSKKKSIFNKKKD